MDWLLLAASILPLAWGWFLIQEIRLAYHLRHTGIQVRGHIVGQHKAKGRYGVPYFIPIARFTTRQGRLVEGRSAGFMTDTKLATKSNVTLYYDAQQPTRFLFSEELGNLPRYVLLAVALGLVIIIWLIA